jgi:hypothetical protein
MTEKAKKSVALAGNRTPTVLIADRPYTKPFRFTHSFFVIIKEHIIGCSRKTKNAKLLTGLLPGIQRLFSYLTGLLPGIQRLSSYLQACCQAYRS